MEVPSAAVMSGFCRTIPPVAVKFPGVKGDPSGLKNRRRGPSEVNNSTLLAVLNGLGNGPTGFGGGPAGKKAGAAATLKAFAAAEWPRVCPLVAMVSRPLYVLRFRYRVS